MKILLRKLLLISALSLFLSESFAQSSDEKDLETLAGTNTKNLVDNSTLSEANLPDKTPKNPGTNKPSPATSDKSQDLISAQQKLDLLKKPLENSTLVNSIQGGMANLLLGNKATSLMFDDKENDNIERAVDSLKSNQLYVPEDGSEDNIDPEAAKKKKEEDDAKEKQKQSEFNAKSYIYLASIMYSTPQDWVVWINDKKITSETNNKTKELYLKSVQKDQVSIMWSVSASKLKVLLGKKAEDLKLKVNDNNQIEVQFILQPNQTFVLGSNSVVEGRAVTSSIIKKKESEQSKFGDKVKQATSGLSNFLQTQSNTAKAAAQ